MEIDLRHALAAAPDDRSSCPPSERLARVAAGEATAEERDLLADHLGNCVACSEEYRVAAGLGPWARDAAADAGGSAGHRRGARRPMPLAYAASILIALTIGGGLGTWAWSLRGENRRLAAALGEQAARLTGAADAEAGRQAAVIADLETRLAQAIAPDLNAPILDLLPRDGVRGAGSATLPRVAARTRHVTLVITTAGDPADRDHDLEIVDSTGTVLWRGSGLRPNRDRVFTAVVPTALLPPGTAHVRLYASGATPRLLADHPLVVER